MPNSRAARNAKRPRPEELRRPKPIKFPADLKQNFLKNIIGIRATDQPCQKAMERRLNVAQQKLQSFTITNLRSQDPVLFLLRTLHTTLSVIGGSIPGKWFDPLNEFVFCRGGL
jgi:hypothetical protein